MARRNLHVLLVLALASCDGAERSLQRTDVDGQVTLAGRAYHAGTLVTAWPGGQQTRADGEGRFHLAGVPIPGLRLVFERPGFALEDIPAPRSLDPLELYRGHRMALPAGFVPVESEAVPPRGTLLRSADGASLLVDLAAEEIRMHMPPGWTPFTDGEGWFVGVDELGGDLEALSVDGRVLDSQDGGWRPERVIHLAPARAPGSGLAPVDSGVLLTRPWVGRPDRLQVALWVPYGEPAVYPGPVVAVGPVVREGEVETIALRTEEGLRLWQPEQPPRALVNAAPEERLALLDMPSSRATRLVCYERGRGAERRVECAGPRFPRRRIAVVGEARAAMLAVDPPAVAWQQPDEAACSICLLSSRGPVGETLGPFPCAAPSLPAWPSGGALILWAADGGVHRLSLDGSERLGSGPALDVNESGLAAFLDDGRLLTVVRPDERVLIAPVSTAADSAVRALPDGAVALEPRGRRLVWLASTGGSRVIDLTEAQVQIGVAASRVYSALGGLLFEGEAGILRIDLERGTARAISHRGWTWIAVGRTDPGKLPDVALARSRDLFEAVDLFTGRVDVLGRGNTGGIDGGRAWFAGPRGLYLVDDAGALSP